MSLRIGLVVVSKFAADEHWNTGYRHELSNFLEAIDEGRRPKSGLPLAINTAAVLYAAYLSAERDGQEVAVSR